MNDNNLVIDDTDYDMAAPASDDYDEGDTTRSERSSSMASSASSSHSSTIKPEHTATSPVSPTTQTNTTAPTTTTTDSSSSSSSVQYNHDHSGDLQVLFDCKICSKLFDNVHRLQRHMLCHDSSPELRKFKCDFCDKAFKFKHHLKVYRQHKILINKSLAFSLPPG
jgi:hypothetical protein